MSGNLWPVRTLVPTERCPTRLLTCHFRYEISGGHLRYAASPETTAGTRGFENEICSLDTLEI